MHKILIVTIATPDGRVLDTVTIVDTDPSIDPIEDAGMVRDYLEQEFETINTTKGDVIP